jgi:CHC2 zinc finger
MSGDAGARREAAGEYMRALFGSAPEGSLVEVRFRVPSGMAQRFMPASRERDVVDAVLSLVARTEVFVGVLPRARPGGRVADVVTRSSVLWADCDTSASVAALASFEPTPSMVVASGSDQHLHAYWFLREPVDLDRLEDLNRRLAAALGADGGVVTKPHTILRPAGSLNRKHSPPALVRLIGLQDGPRPGADEIDLPLPRERTEPASTSHAGLSRAPSPIASSDPLLLVPPPLYFERLTGLRVGQSGKLRCLFHDDRSPSLHVYREPGRGWYCFGCGRGGSIYDLAALLSGRETRGQNFSALRRELEELLLPLSLVSHSERSWTRGLRRDDFLDPDGWIARHCRI